nr:hypothetical protein [Allomuricauda sp.]
MWPKFLSRIVVIFSVFLLGCDRDDTPATLEGTYEGIFTVTYMNNETFSNPVEVTLMNGRFSSTAGPNRYPAGGNGDYEVMSGTIEFIDENFWTADFDWNLILSGAYSYSLSGDTLVISAEKNNVGVYTYELNRK